MNDVEVEGQRVHPAYLEVLRVLEPIEDGARDAAIEGRRHRRAVVGEQLARLLGVEALRELREHGAEALEEGGRQLAHHPVGDHVGRVVAPVHGPPVEVQPALRRHSGARRQPARAVQRPHEVDPHALLDRSVAMDHDGLGHARRRCLAAIQVRQGVVFVRDAQRHRLAAGEVATGRFAEAWVAGGAPQFRRRELGHCTGFLRSELRKEPLRARSKVRGPLGSRCLHREQLGRRTGPAGSKHKRGEEGGQGRTEAGQ
mmetsp:Transcript_88442/g.245578  ORF Transcript_88442/g.245578 Transcript_88442/m.245578 type:complete len:257 (-) Transcript_88442:136-906(-)